MDFGTNRSAPQRLMVLRILMILLSCLALPVCTKAAAHSKEYKSSDVPKDIPGRGTETSILTIADGGPILDLNVKVNFTHPSDADLDVFLIAPDGTRVELFTDVGGTSANFEDTILDDEASQSITDGSAPFTGSYRPEGSLAVLKGKSIAGTWTLEVTDDWSVNRAGTLNSWSLIVESEAQEPLPAPVIHVEQSVPGGIYNTVCWEDGAAKQHQEYVSNVEVHIPDNGTATSTLTIEDVGMIADLNVKLDILHGRDSDLDVFLIAPDKTRIELFTDVGGQGYHFTDTVLDDDAAQSITEGSAPFTGSYRPEGNLSGLAGKEIHGAWTLEVTDDSAGAVGTLNHWSVSVAVADTLYYAECATDAGFATIAADSGWVSGNSYTFSGLAWNRQYWYRVKARPMETWCQTSQSDFAADTLTSTQTTEDGDVVLGRSGSGDRGPQNYVIQNPSFEYWGGWTFASNDPLLLANGVNIWGGLWSSDGLWAGGILMGSDSSYPKGDYGYLLQRNIDWTSVGTLVFDYCSFYGSDLTSQILIGDQEVWSHTHTDRWAADHYGLEVDVSGITGRRDLKLRTEVTGYSARNSAVLWDKLRTYSVVGYVSSGTVISTLVSIGEGDTWDLLRFNSTTPAGAALTVDVLPETGSMPIDPWRQIPGAGDGLTAMGLGDLAARTIRLRANLSTGNPSVTPVLHDWTLTYSDAARQSAWSNIATELPPPRVPTTIEKASGDNQSGPQGSKLALPLKVRVKDQNGAVMANVQVDFVVIAGGGTVQPSSATTGSDGTASTELTLGPTPGLNQVKASVGSLSVTFSATGLPPRVPTTIEKASGDNQSGLPGSKLTLPLTVRVKDQNGAVMANVQVDFAVIAGGGTVQPSSAMTGFNGTASTELTLGPAPGLNQVKASVGNLSVTFSATGLPPPVPTTIEKASGDNQSGLPDSKLTLPLTARVKDQNGAVMANVQVDFAVISGGGTVQPSSAMTGSNGTASTELTLGPAPGLNQVKASVGSLSVTFSATGLPPERYSGGSGTTGDPYKLATAEDLILLGDSPQDYGKHFVLTADIDLAPNLPGRRTFNKAAIAPTPSWQGGADFTGVFNGDGHTISHLRITVSGGRGYMALFGNLGPGAQVRNLGIENVDISGSGDQAAGALVGWNNSGMVTQCYSTGSIKFDVMGRVGGLVGVNQGNVTQCYSTAAVKGYWEVGGLVGTNDGAVIQCYSTGLVQGTSSVGGLVGNNNDFLPGTVTACFWDRQTSGQATSDGGTGKTTAEMKRTATFTGWDFRSVWTIREGIDYPKFRWEEPSAPPPPPPAQTRITSVVRANGESDNRAPIGQYNGYTSPLPTEAGGLKDGNLCFSDRTYPWANTPAQLAGVEYVRTFNSDKKSTTVTYTVTLSRESNVMVTVDNRISDRQAAVNQATARFAPPGTFTDTRQRLYIRENATTDTMISVFSARLPAGTYVFSAMPSVNNFYTIAAMD